MQKIILSLIYLAVCSFNSFADTKLEGKLEKSLRDIHSRQSTINQIAHAIVDAIILGVNQESSFNPLLQEGDIFLPGSDL